MDTTQSEQTQSRLLTIENLYTPDQLEALRLDEEIRLRDQEIGEYIAKHFRPLPSQRSPDTEPDKPRIDPTLTIGWAKTAYHLGRELSELKRLLVRVFRATHQAYVAPLNASAKSPEAMRLFSAWWPPAETLKAMDELTRSRSHRPEEPAFYDLEVAAANLEKAGDEMSLLQFLHILSWQEHSLFHARERYRKDKAHFSEPKVTSEEEQANPLTIDKAFQSLVIASKEGVSQLRTTFPTLTAEHLAGITELYGRTFDRAA